MYEEQEDYSELRNSILELSKDLKINLQDRLRVNSKQLITLIRHCTFIYDRNSEDFKNNLKKNAAWEAIAEAFNLPVEKVQIRWRCLREMFSRYKRQVVLNPNASSSRKAFPYYEDMLFVDQYIMQRKMITPVLCHNSKRKTLEDGDLIKEVKKRPSIPITSLPSENCLQKLNFDLKDEVLSVSSLDFDYPEVTDTMDPSLREETDSLYYKVKVEPQESNDDEINTGVKNIEYMDFSKSNFSNDMYQEPSSSVQNNDEDDLFCKTINAELRQIKSRKRKMKIKADIFKILYDNENS